METTHLNIQGMNCGACVNHVTKALQSVAGVQSVDVDLASGRATVQHEPGTDPTNMVQAVDEAGFEAHSVGDANAQA